MARASWSVRPVRKDVALTGPDGLLMALIKILIETPVEEEMADAPRL